MVSWTKVIKMERSQDTWDTFLMNDGLLLRVFLNVEGGE